MDEKCIRNLIFSIDDCDNTGDHESYFDESIVAYDIDGTQYTNCTKKAVRYRSSEEHEFLSSLTNIVFLLYDGSNYISVNHEQLSKKKEMIDPKYSWVLYTLFSFLDRDFLFKKSLRFIHVLICFIVFSLHLFKNYGNNGDCLDMELSYYLECSNLVQTGQSGTAAICQANGEFTVINKKNFWRIWLSYHWMPFFQIYALLSRSILKIID